MKKIKITDKKVIEEIEELNRAGDVAVAAFRAASVLVAEENKRLWGFINNEFPETKDMYLRLNRGKMEISILCPTGDKKVTK